VALAVALPAGGFGVADELLRPGPFAVPLLPGHLEPAFQAADLRRGGVLGLAGRLELGFEAGDRLLQLGPQRPAGSGRGVLAAPGAELCDAPEDALDVRHRFRHWNCSPQIV
jgi:hypothetical protein